MRVWIQRLKLVLAASMLTAISCVIGCGGEVGGGPSGIGAALTNVQLSAAVLALGLQDPQLVSANIPPGAVAAVDADEFALTLTGAGFDRRDITFTFPVGKGVTFNAGGATLEDRYVATFSPGFGVSGAVKVVPMFQEMDSAPRGDPEPATETVVENGVDRIRVKPPLRVDGNLLFEIATRTVRTSPTTTVVIEAGTLRSNVTNFRPWEGLFDYRVIAERLLNKLNFEVILEFSGGSLPVNAPYRVLFTSRQTISILEEPGNPNSGYTKRLVLTKGYNEIGGLGDPTLQYSAPVLLTVNVNDIPVAATGIRITAIEQSINDSVGGSDAGGVVTRFELDLPRNGSNFDDGAEQTQFIIINRLRRFRIEARAYIEDEGSVGRTAAVAYGATRQTSTGATGFNLLDKGYVLSIPAGVGTPPAVSVTMKSQIIDVDTVAGDLTSATGASLRDGRLVTITPANASILFTFNVPGEVRDDATFRSRVNVVDVGVDSIPKLVAVDLPNDVGSLGTENDDAVAFDEADDPQVLTEDADGVFVSETDISVNDRVIRVTLLPGAFSAGAVPADPGLRVHTAALSINSPGNARTLALTASATPGGVNVGYPLRARSVVFFAEELNTALGPPSGPPYNFSAFQDASGNADFPGTAAASVGIIDRNLFYRIRVEARSETGGAGVVLARGIRDFNPATTPDIEGARFGDAAGAVPFTETLVTNGSLRLRYNGSDGPITLQRGQTITLSAFMTVNGNLVQLPAGLFQFGEANDPGDFLSVSGANVTFRSNAPTGIQPVSLTGDIRVRVTYQDPVHGAMTDDLRFVVTGSGSGTVN